MLYLIPTPIGNLKDITLRSLETLKEVDAIICEDTRRTKILLNFYQIEKPLIVLNDFNENKTFTSILDRLNLGQNLALVSDAGTPLISDPGFKLVREALKQNIQVDSLPGASAVTTALTLSALPPDKFLFLGFLPDKQGNREKIYQQISQVKDILNLTFILFISPYKILNTLEELSQKFGDINIVLAKELTKIHQNVKSLPISEWINQYKKNKPKGEYVLLINFSS